MSAAEFGEWIAYAELEPFGPVRLDQLVGTVAATLVNIYTERGAKPKTWVDFFPPYERRMPPATTPEALWGKAMQLHKLFGGN